MFDTFDDADDDAKQMTWGCTSCGKELTEENSWSGVFCNECYDKELPSLTERVNPIPVYRYEPEQIRYFKEHEHGLHSRGSLTKIGVDNKRRIKGIV